MIELTNEQLKNKSVFEEMPLGKAMASLAVPTIIGQLIILIYNMADTFFIGRTNNPYMVAGASLILPFFNLSLSFACLTGIGGGSVIARLLGVGDYPSAKRIFSFSSWFSVIIGVLFASLTYLFMNPLLNLLGASAETYEYAKIYSLCVICIGGIPTVLSMTLASLLRSSGYARLSGFGVSMGGILNILLDPLFMFVILPKGNEILGAGIATALSNVIVCTFFVILVLTSEKGSILNLNLKNAIPTKKDFASVISIGVPSGINTLLFDVDYIVIDKLMSGYGAIPLAAIGIVLKIERLPLNVGIGLCQGIMPLAGYNYSAKNYDRMAKSIRYSRLVGIGVAAVAVIFNTLFADSILRFFINNPETVSVGASFLRIRILATCFMFLSFHVLHAYQAFGDAKMSLFLAVFRWIVLNIPALYILNALFGMMGLVWAQLIADVLCAAISLVIYSRYINKLMAKK